MRKDDERDASIDTFLRSSLRSGQPAPGSSGPCVEPEAIAAWTEGTLSPKEAAAVESHIASCATCQQVLAVFARTTPPPDVSPSLWERWHLRWAVPVAAAATAVAIWVAVPDDRKAPIQDAFTVADSVPPAEQSQPAEQTQPAGKSEPADAVAPSSARERSEPLARRDADSSLRAQAENREVRQEKEEADSQGLVRESARAAAPAASPAAAAAPPPVVQGEPRTLADAAAAPAQERASAFAPAEVVSPDPAVRWRVLTTGQLERSTNAGQTWEPIPLPHKVTAVRALSATTAIVTATDGRQFRTDDQGKTWNPVQP